MELIIGAVVLTVMCVGFYWLVYDNGDEAIDRLFDKIKARLK